jgi:hypothetical protein
MAYAGVRTFSSFSLLRYSARADGREDSARLQANWIEDESVNWNR